MFQEYLEFLKNFGQNSFFLGFWQFIKSWWWVPLPFFLWKYFLFLWGWWRTFEVWLNKQEMAILEVKIPSESVKPIRAMEVVISEIFQTIYKPPDAWEKWIDGQTQLSFSLEVASIEGNIHFFIRFDKSVKDAVEAAIYSQYPEAEVAEVKDYTKEVPPNIPNKEWDLWGTNYRLLKKDPYPIKTYKYFETEREALEEKIVDPLANLLEGMAKVGKGEQLWLQIIAKPIQQKDFPDKKYWKESEEVKEELARRAKKAPPKKPILLETFEALVYGKVMEKSTEEKELIPPEMKLTPGERETLAAVEEKTSKVCFQTVIRFIYLGKKEFFSKAKIRLIFSYFSSFSTLNCNALVPKGQPIITKIKKNWFLPINFLKNRRLYLRKRRIFRLYKSREEPFFPKMTEEGTQVLNTEEIATLFHFPAKGTTLAPFMPRTETKKGEAPSDLPIEI